MKTMLAQPAGKFFLVFVYKVSGFTRPKTVNLHKVA